MNDPSHDAHPGLRSLEEGAVFAGRFRVARLLGQGGMGSVYEAVQVALDRRVALKLLHPALTLDLSIVQRFQREAKLMATLRHPNVVEVIDAGVDAGALWIAMEFLEGESLASWLDARDGRSSLEALLPLLSPVGDALSYMHGRGIVHRDVKPDNVMLARGEGGAIVPKVLDLGIAHPRTEHGEKLTATGALLGTPAYIAPEQAWGVADISPAADQWSFAAMIYEALTGHLPHEAETPMGIITQRVTAPPAPPGAYVHDFDPALSAVLLRALSTAPEDRFPSLRALLDALAPFARHDAPPSPIEALPRAPTQVAPRATPLGLSLPPAPKPPEPIAAQSISPLPLTPSPRWPWIVAIALVAALAVAGARWLTPAPIPHDAGVALASRVDASTGEVTFAFAFAPSNARISLDDNVIGAGHASIRAPRDGRLYALRVEADGFVPYREVLRASGDVQISRTLLPRDAGAAPAPLPHAAPPRPQPRAPGDPPVVIQHRRPIDQTWPP